jgi:hypothetical protein
VSRSGGGHVPADALRAYDVDAAAMHI